MRRTETIARFRRIQGTKDRMPSFEVKINSFKYEENVRDYEEFKINLTLPNQAEFEYIISQLLGYEDNTDRTYHKFHIKRIQYMRGSMLKQKNMPREDHKIFFKFKRTVSGKLEKYVFDRASISYYTEVAHFACPGIKQIIYGAKGKFCQQTEMYYIFDGLRDVFLSSLDDTVPTNCLSYEVMDFEEYSVKDVYVEICSTDEEQSVQENRENYETAVKDNEKENQEHKEYDENDNVNMETEDEQTETSYIRISGTDDENIAEKGSIQTISDTNSDELINDYHEPDFCADSPFQFPISLIQSSNEDSILNVVD